ncbi:MAG: class I SAM-dependent rRNA methyltransferase [Acidimicrobiales bacterium]|nr:class I SAM-dependent rRNA methyltransferase [Acidimicrobiales bacterium]
MRAGSAPGGVTPQAGTAGRRRLAVRVTKDAERQLRGGHPWVFDRSITSVTDGGVPGDLAVVFDAKRRFLAIGLYDPSSPIRVRVLHQGEPTPIDREWWHARLRDALDRRAELVASADTTGYRWVHGENDALPGLVVDRYGPTSVVKLYSAAWFPHLPVVVESLAELVETESVVLRLARNVTPPDDGRGDLADGSALVGSLPEHPVRFLEHGLAFEADVVRGQKTGFFLDQRDNRARVGELARGRRVLDLFCCTGGFSVHAAAGGAAEVHSVDISPGAIEAATRNMDANSGVTAVARCRHETLVGDAADQMVALARSGERYGLVVLDPPSLASRGPQRAAALGAYRRLGELATDLVEPGGTLVAASCSSRIGADEHAETIAEAVAQRGRTLTGITRTGHAVDHPVGFAEGAYLKAVIATVP